MTVTYRIEPTSKAADDVMAVLFTHKIVRSDGEVVGWAESEADASLRLGILRAEFGGE